MYEDNKQNSVLLKYAALNFSIKHNIERKFIIQVKVKHLLFLKFFIRFS